MILAIKEMVYKTEWLTLDKAEVLSRGSYKGYDYLVVSYGIHPCAYIALEEGQPFYRACLCEDVDVQCHGGCTFVEWGYGKLFNHTYKVIGWDYGHYDDFSGSSIKWGTEWNARSKKWTTEEMVQECRDVIERLYVIEHPELYYK